MKKYLIFIMAALLLGVQANAQDSFLQRLGNSAKNRAESTARYKTEQAVDKAIDKAADKISDLFKKKDKKDDGKAAADNGWTCPSCGATGNTGNFCQSCGAKKPEPKQEQNGWTCPSCGATGNTGNFCQSCGTKKPDGNAAAAQGGWTCPDCGKVGNTGNFCDDCGAKKPDGQGAAATWTCEKCGHAGNTGNFCDECGSAKGAQKVNSNTLTWNNYDFVAGDQIIFDDDNSSEPLGEFPMKWDAFSGAAEIVQINGVKCINLQDADITPLYQDGKTYLTDCFTLEFDAYFRHEMAWEKEMGEDLHGWGDIYVDLINEDRISKDWNWDNRCLTFHFCIQQDTDFNTKAEDKDFHYNWWAQSNNEEREGTYNLRSVESEAWHHIAVSFNKRAYKIYFDDQRVANIPNAKVPKWFKIRGNNANQRLFFIKNVRIAQGAVPLYDRLQSDGKIVTYGITFDSGKATIKPESTGEINRIKDIMNQDPSIKFEVQGHCDSTGSAAVNDRLSQQRAEAIVAALVGQGISAGRLTAVGKGSHEPVADNSTDEGRAKNRRVEFVKK